MNRLRVLRLRELCACVLSGLLVAGPGLAQDDFEMPEGDFEMPEGDFEGEPADDDEDILVEDEPEPAPEPARKPKPKPKPEKKPAPEKKPKRNLWSDPEEPEAAPSDPPRRPLGEGSTGTNEPREPARPVVEEPRRPVVVEPRRPIVGEDAVTLPVEEPPETEDGDAVVWVATGVGTVLGVAVLAGLGVGGFLLLNSPSGPTGSITVTPR